MIKKHDKKHYKKHDQKHEQKIILYLIILQNSQSPDCENLNLDKIIAVANRNIFTHPNPSIVNISNKKV